MFLLRIVLSPGRNGLLGDRVMWHSFLRVDVHLFPRQVLDLQLATNSLVVDSSDTSDSEEEGPLASGLTPQRYPRQRDRLPSESPLPERPFFGKRVYLLSSLSIDIFSNRSWCGRIVNKGNQYGRKNVKRKSVFLHFMYSVVLRSIKNIQARVYLIRGEFTCTIPT